MEQRIFAHVAVRKHFLDKVVHLRPLAAVGIFDIFINIEFSRERQVILLLSVSEFARLHIEDAIATSEQMAVLIDLLVEFLVEKQFLALLHDITLVLGSLEFNTYLL